MNDKKQLNNSNILNFYAKFYLKQMLCFLRKKTKKNLFSDVKNLAVIDYFSTKKYRKKLRTSNMIRVKFFFLKQDYQKKTNIKSF